MTRCMLISEPVLNFYKKEHGYMLSIGEFSKLAHISTRMLRHYDRIGLLHPSHVGMKMVTGTMSKHNWIHWQKLRH